MSDEIISIMLVVFLAGCITQQQTTTTTTITTTTTTPAECVTNKDCGVGGCSGQICGPKDEVRDIITTCEWKPEYDCIKKTKCTCINGKCDWFENEEYLKCMGTLGLI